MVTNKSVELKGHTLQQLDSIISAKGQTAYSSVVLGKVDNKLLTMQITLPADNQQKAQTAAENIINTLVITRMPWPPSLAPGAIFLPRLSD